MHSLIIGHKGQDGTLLQEQLNQDGLSWIGIDRDAIDMAGISLSSFPDSINITNPDHVQEIVRKCQPETIYYLAAHHCSSRMQPQFLVPNFRAGMAVNIQGLLNFLEAIAKFSPKSKLLYVSSSLIYASKLSSDQYITESSTLAPSESYAYEKLLAGHYCREYRNKYHVFASVAIPFNHESIYRPPGFFTRDVTDAIAKIHLEIIKDWEVGSLNAIVDWLYAGDVVNAMRCILRLNVPDDFIIASGIGHTTGEFIKIACEYTNIDFEKVIRVNSKLITRENNCRIGDATKLRLATGWQATLQFPDLVKQLMQAAIDRAIKEQQ